jgi:hypothetical protein
LVVTIAVAVPPAVVGAHASGDTLTVAAPAVWRMLISRSTDSARTVTVALRLAEVGFASAVSVRFSPVAPVLGEIVTQGSEDVACHDSQFVVTLTVAVEGVELAVHDDMESESEGLAPIWVTAIVADAVPAVTVTVAVRDLVIGVGRAVSINVSPETPAAGETVSQLSDDAACHPAAFVVTVTTRVPPYSTGSHVVAVTDTVARPAAWVTVTVADAVPAVKVTVAVRAARVGLDWAVSVMTVPLFPVAGDGLTQDSDEDARHVPMLVVTVTRWLPPVPGASHDVCETAMLGPPAGWVTLIVADAVPAVTVTVAVRAVTVGLAAAVTVSVAPVAAEEGETVTQDWDEVACHADVFVVTVAVWVPPATGASHDVRESVMLAAPASWVTVIVADAVPAVTVTVAVRAATVGLATAKSDSVAPVAPEAGETLTQGWDEVACHPEVLVVTVAVCDPPDAEAVQVVRESDTVGSLPAWDTRNKAEPPSDARWRLAVRASPSFAVTATVTSPGCPWRGVRVTQPGHEESLQVP